jgi:hypothetical protein
MWRHNWLYVSVLACAIVLLGGLALVTGPAQAQSLPGAQGQGAGLSPAQQALISDLGVHNPYAQSILHRMRDKGAAPSGKPVGKPEGPASTRTGWSVVPSPNVGDGLNQLSAVGGVNANDMWAVGYYCSSGCGEDEVDSTLVEHWNGSAWVVVPSPNIGAGTNFLNAVAVISPNDAWAVGYFRNLDTNHWNTLAIHWDGSQWSIAPTPNPGTANKYLYQVTATSHKDVWAFGGYRQDDVFLAWAIHWDGTGWTDASVPNPSAFYNVFYGATQISRNDAWAVGFYCIDTDCFDERNLTEHWDGHTWSVVPNPPIPNNINLFGVGGSTKKDVWAAGDRCVDSNCNDFENYVEHWNGVAWSLVPVSGPTINVYYSSPLGISRNDAYIVGSQPDGSNLVLHWDGTAWSNVSVPNSGAVNNVLLAAVAFGRNNVWAVGFFDNGDGERTQVLHYDVPGQ